MKLSFYHYHNVPIRYQKAHILFTRNTNLGLCRQLTVLKDNSLAGNTCYFCITYVGKHSTIVIATGEYLHIDFQKLLGDKSLSEIKNHTE